VAVEIILALWTQKEATFEGKYYEVRGAVNEPKGVQKPHIPLMMAGGGEKLTLRLVAQYGDACNIMNSPELKYAVLKKHCAEVGRDFNAVNRTATTAAIIRDTDEEARALVSPGSQFAYPGDLGSYGLIGTVDTVKKRIDAFEAAGVQELVVNFQDPTSVGRHGWQSPSEAQLRPRMVGARDLRVAARALAAVTTSRPPPGRWRAGRRTAGRRQDCSPAARRASRQSPHAALTRGLPWSLPGLVEECDDAWRPGARARPG
jgi:hypothetical protein